MQVCLACGSQDVAVIPAVVKPGWVCCRTCGAASGSGGLGTDVDRHELVPHGDLERAEEFLEVRGPTYSTVAARLARELKEGAHVLDFGCSFGGMIRELEERGFLASGVDINPLAVQFVNRNRDCEVASIGSTLTCVTGQFDAILALDVFEYTHDERRELSAAASLLPPGGLLVIRTPNKRWLVDVALRVGRVNSKIGQRVFDKAVLTHDLVQSPRSLATLIVSAGFGRVSIEADTGIVGTVTKASRLFYESDKLIARVAGRPVIAPGVMIYAWRA